MTRESEDKPKARRMYLPKVHPLKTYPKYAKKTRQKELISSTETVGKTHEQRRRTDDK